jgi:hypothetical protein
LVCRRSNLSQKKQVQAETLRNCEHFNHYSAMSRVVINQLQRQRKLFDTAKLRSFQSNYISTTTANESNTVRITFLRHGQSTWNQQNIFIGMFLYRVVLSCIKILFQCIVLRIKYQDSKKSFAISVPINLLNDISTIS